ncbi:AAA domain containing protein [uncultured Caudovirales phage]|uniref:AAA domain containing protein n=1 Tax=uncultured Caudovirales phage TaxID=2100421 RepID=A0A6J5PDA2_9CAUD|nr:AAA domain containing protein [uncultured Caudovirales phage]
MMLSNVTKGKIKRPYSIVIFGADGCGKSTFASGAPNPIFLGTEQGTNNLDVTRFQTPKNWGDVNQAIDELIKEKHDYKTLVIDSLDWLEPLLHQKICVENRVNSIELAAGGFGKGYIAALNEFIAIKDKFNVLRDTKSMNIILIAHSQVITFNDPQNQTQYDRFEMKLHKKSSAMFREYVDAVLFASYQTFTSKEGNLTKHHGDGARIMYTERRPGFDAKNRLGLPFTMDLSWDAFEKAADIGEPESSEAILARIQGLISEVPPDLLPKVKDTIEKAGSKVVQLQAIENRLKILINKEG